MRFWAISPNVTNNANEESAWKKTIEEYGIAIMGWSEEDNIGKRFVNDVSIGDFILIAQGANRNKRVLLAGLVKGNAINGFLVGAPRAAWYRELNQLICKEELESLSLSFNGAAYGDSSQIPALYEFYPNTNPADKIIAEKLTNFLKERERQMKMQSNIELLIRKKQVILQGPPGTGKTYIAKDIAEQIIFSKITDNKKEQKASLEATDQFKLIQFHPAYSYEDFVRGIKAVPIGNAIEYRTEDKVLAKMAKEAHVNFINSQKAADELSKELWVQQNLEDYAESIQDKIDTHEKVAIGDTTTYIFEVEEDAFRYKGDNWEKHAKGLRMKYKDLIQMYFDGIETRQDIKKMTNVSSLAIQHASYSVKVLTDFKKFLNGRPPYTVISKEELKNYVLIIDEINRANLPSVLGELIYALEYRGEAVDSMYDIDGDTKIVLPPNLFIIGTMNTADRSVGHIDYAIRRRFAFVDVLPIPEVIENPKSKEYFTSLQLLFRDHTASDFSSKDVSLGHSYFIVKDDAELKQKLKYEVLPILNEYIKDGILLLKNEQTEAYLRSLEQEISA